MALDLPPADRLPIAIRTFASRKSKPSKRPSRARTLGLDVPSDHVVVFDCETTTDPSQKLRIGSYQHREAGALREAGLFYADDLPASDFAVLSDYAREHRLPLRTREAFVEDVLLKYGWERGGTIVGLNLPFDLARIAVTSGVGRENMYGGFRLTLSADRRRPGVHVKHVTRRFSMIGFAPPWASDTNRSMRKRGEDTPKRSGYFVDVRTLASALFSRSHSLASLCEALRVPLPKLKGAVHGAPLTPDYIAYAVRDTEATWTCYAALVDRYRALGLTRTPVHRIYSEASLGKAYLDAMRIKPAPEARPSVPPKLLATILHAYYGGRAEVRERREVREVVHCDFLSMYPTVCTLMQLWSFVIADNMSSRDGTDEVQRFLDEVTLGTLQDQSTWSRLAAIVEVQPEGDVFPVRARYDEAHDETIGLNHLSVEGGLWFTLADCVASKILTGCTPRVVQAIVFAPGEPQPGLRPIALNGNRELMVDPRREDVFKRIIELRRDVQRHAAECDGAPAEALRTEGQALKIVANATSYGCFVELNVQEHAEPIMMAVHRAGVPSFEYPTRSEEKPGRYFHPLLSTLITGAARLMLAITERLVVDRGLAWAFCDTDSMALARPPAMDRAEFHARADAIVAWFECLNPYAFPGSILQLEKWNFSLNDKVRREPLYCWCVSAKRYALFNLGSANRPIIRKATAHGIGDLIAPYDESSPSVGIPRPAALSEIGVELWQHDLWFQIIAAALDGHPDTVDLDYHSALSDPAVSRYAATSPRLLRWFGLFDKGKPYPEQVKPFNFLYALQAKRFLDAEVNGLETSGSRTRRQKRRVRPVAPFASSLAEAIAQAFDRETVITHACDGGGDQASTVLRMVPKVPAPARRAVSTTVRIEASPSAAHIAR